MASGTYVPGSATVSALRWMREVWPGELDVLAYERAVLAGWCRDFGPPGNKIHIPKFDDLSRTIISETLTGATGLTFVGNAETEFTAQPGTSVVPVEVTESVLWRMAFDPTDDIRTATENMLWQAIDSDLLSLAAAFSTNIVGDPAANPQKADYLDAYQRVTGGAKKLAEPGQGNIRCIVANTQVDDLGGITDFMSAQVRGDSANPTVSGWLGHVMGMDFLESTSVNTTSGFSANMALINRAIGIGYNQRPTVETQMYQIWKRVFAVADYAYGTIRDQYCCLIKGPTT